MIEATSPFELPSFTDAEAYAELRAMASQQRRNATQADRAYDRVGYRVGAEIRRNARLLDRMADYLAQRL